MDALAESILMELAACLRSDIWDRNVWSDYEITVLKKNIVSLAEAADDEPAFAWWVPHV